MTLTATVQRGHVYRKGAASGEKAAFQHALGFEIHYMFQGSVHKFRPDFIVRQWSGEMLVVEVKGRDSQQDQTKREFLREWVDAVNQHGGFGKWRSAAVFNAQEISGVLEHD